MTLAPFSLRRCPAAVFLAAFLACCISFHVSAAYPFKAGERLEYRVMYRWGLINKQAGTAVLSLAEGASAGTFDALLTARSEPWADKIYCVRDTLRGTFLKDGIIPLFYEKIAHEKNEDKHDTVRFMYDGNTVRGHTTRRVVKKGELKRDEKLELSAVGVAVDMLSSFYYMRSLPFNEWQPGHKRVLSIFSGKQKETLTFEYKGIERVEVGERHYQCFHITFIFTGDGGKKTSDNMDAWLTTGPGRIPVLLEGKLPVGKVTCELIR